MFTKHYIDRLHYSFNGLPGITSHVIASGYIATTWCFSNPAMPGPERAMPASKFPMESPDWAMPASKSRGKK